MEHALLHEIGAELHNALRQAEAIAPLTERYPQLTLEDAYAIQQQLIARRLDDGERVVGKKIGVTSQAVMNLLGVAQPDFGILTDAMTVNSGEAISTASLIQPKAEGELAFVLKHDLMGPGVTVADVLRATEGVMVCFEIVDSRIRDWKIKIQDTVADNASCGVFVLSDRLVPVQDVDLSLCGMVLEKNGEIVATGAGAASMGSPAVAVAWLANTLGHLGMPLKAGEVILSGSLGPMIPVRAGDNLRVSIGGVGSCSVRFA
ncbi:2-oxopent-4-enoate hydratase [Pseudomonas lalucatii]|uniref:2-oxopent-4-enoate hydratase n=1 Tax=Pseudomonas lalucatii TaxID=1424203 RepID=A0ABS5Q4B9_9PSED|nr:2-oxopent-4-enoate hydratase [Pseudomonas lalucatii]MBS7725116.1 2-oxopent-4-enoate hydratase [Pseudomonas lalucatii]QVM88928.1 2-oxopent-4-enoate hydratase [Pseudomonas lalucatii]